MNIYAHSIPPAPLRTGNTNARPRPSTQGTTGKYDNLAHDFQIRSARDATRVRVQLIRFPCRAKSKYILYTPAHLCGGGAHFKAVLLPLARQRERAGESTMILLFAPSRAKHKNEHIKCETRRNCACAIVIRR